VAAEVDVLRYRLSVLTGAALLDGLVVALARKYKAEAGKAASGSRCRDDQVTMEVWQEHVRRAICDIRGVDLDIQDLLDVSEVFALLPVFGMSITLMDSLPLGRS